MIINDNENFCRVVAGNDYTENNKNNTICR